MRHKQRHAPHEIHRFGQHPPEDRPPEPLVAPQPADFRVRSSA